MFSISSRTDNARKILLLEEAASNRVSIMDKYVDKANKKMPCAALHQLIAALVDRNFVLLCVLCINDA